MRLNISAVSRVTMIAAMAALSMAGLAHAQYDPPASYYNSATGTGATLKSQLTTIMSTGHVQRNYGNYRDMSVIIDADPNISGNILLVYNRASVSGAWDGGATWNREHTWPDSRQPGNANNSATGAISDPHMLRPCNPSINSSRSNDPYGMDGTTGSYQHVGSYYYPGDADQGDVARAQFYAATRWSSDGLTLTDSFPSGFQMGDLSSLLHYHYRDVPDTFERRRNHAISSQAMNPSYYTNNRNAYVDRPEYVWSVYADQQNDTQLSVAAPDANGGSTATVNLGRVLRNAAVPGAQNVTLNKAGVDGTYYSVTAGGAATSTVNGRYNAFVMDSTGSRTIGVGLSTSTATAGLKSGSVVIDNLDVTTAGGAGRGANDGNDTINVSLSVLDASNSSFGATDTNTLSINFGSVLPGAVVSPQGFSIFNVASSLGAGLTAGLDLDSVLGSGDTSVFSTNLATFSNLSAGASNGRLAFFDTSSLGSFAATYTLNFSDENLPGTIGTTQLTLNITGTVVPEPTSLALVGLAGLGLLRRRRRGKPGSSLIEISI